MKKTQTLTELQMIVNLQKPDFDNSLSNFPNQDKIKFRRDRINRLRIQGYSNEKIAEKLGCSISTVEKDLYEIRECSRKWYDEESVTDFCQSLQDSIILCDNAIEELQIHYSEAIDLSSKILILKSILEFEHRKTELYHETRSVQNFCGEFLN